MNDLNVKILLLSIFQKYKITFLGLKYVFILWTGNVIIIDIIFRLFHFVFIELKEKNY